MDVTLPAHSPTRSSHFKSSLPLVPSHHQKLSPCAWWADQVGSNANGMVKGHNCFLLIRFVSLMGFSQLLVVDWRLQLRRQIQNCDDLQLKRCNLGMWKSCWLCIVEKMRYRHGNGWKHENLHILWPCQNWVYLTGMFTGLESYPAITAASDPQTQSHTSLLFLSAPAAFVAHSDCIGHMKSAQEGFH